MPRQFMRLISAWILSVTFAASGFSATAPIRVNIGTASASSSALSLWFAQEQGIFSKHGIEAQIILIRGGPTLVASIVAGDIHMAFTSGVSVLGAAAQGLDVKMLSSISSGVSWKLMANSQIRRPQDLRGKRLGVQSIVGSTWMYSMLALEHLGLEPKRDSISFIQTGDPVTTAHALEAGRIDAAALEPALSRRLTTKGFTMLTDLSQTTVAFPGLGIGVTQSYLEQHTAIAERVVNALAESLVFVQMPANKPLVLRSMMKNLRMNDPQAAEEGYQDLLGTLNRKPYPSLDGLRNAQRLMVVQNPKVANLKVEDLVDSRFIRKLDESGFIDKLYGAAR
jgi:NitT/TauT family transport system substrate-binding protein